ncbi:helix-turn-helix domain-containing protein [Nocardia wallacei]|uniref:helix-turn-helix domain-containing protein n=1 Tax=Nocardia wallacei TaxID=480035 RepID=UPI0016574A7C|nr:helix-turn-helix domain-containing protein [Nocardia wallacei]
MAEHPRLHSIPGGRDDRSPARPEEPVREPLWREVLGERLRALRQEHGETLAETAKRAGVSPQYLSEVERGRKEPSSEMIAALAGALGTSLGGLTEQVADELRRQRRLARPAVRRPAVLPTLAGTPDLSPADLIELANQRRRIVRTRPAVPERAGRDRDTGPTLMALAA